MGIVSGCFSLKGLLKPITLVFPGRRSLWSKAWQGLFKGLNRKSTIYRATVQTAHLASKWLMLLGQSHSLLHCYNCITKLHCNNHIVTIALQNSHPHLLDVLTPFSFFTDIVKTNQNNKFTKLHKNLIVSLISIKDCPHWNENRINGTWWALVVALKAFNPLQAWKIKSVFDLCNLTKAEI